MQTKQLIEELVTRELKPLCKSCGLDGECAYQKASTRTIIQCDVYVEGSNEAVSEKLLGLCAICDNANHCTLQARKHGTWHCPNFL